MNRDDRSQLAALIEREQSLPQASVTYDNPTRWSLTDLINKVERQPNPTTTTWQKDPLVEAGLANLLVKPPLPQRKPQLGRVLNSSWNLLQDMAMKPVNSLDDILNSILEKEGGYVNHPRDKGGPTQYGITKRAYADYYNKPLELVRVADIKALTPEQAKDIYRTLYIDRPGYADIPDYSVKHQVSDMAVHHGPKNTTKMLQKAVYSLGHKVSLDGVYGPETSNAIKEVLKKKGPEAFNKELSIQRENFLRSIVRRNPNQSTFLRGWLNRARSFLPEKPSKEKNKETNQ